MAHEKTFVLPVQIISPSDVGRLIRELDAINENMLQLKLRKPGAEVKMPKTSHLMEQVADNNKLNLLHEDDRQTLDKALRFIREKSPIMHISFSADPSISFLEKVVAWLRKEVDPMTLVTIGLQPNLGAGCIVRTTNQRFDLSLKQHFARQRDLLKSKLVEELKQ